ncbi:hypothetical protein DEU56DRAFT_926810 [Suillus clintonianus]|uniref:uncharacterized protein n=1 Tax=Suillus clintonianus TaxID=1904413 RepID=UPI001B8837D3|nr:uncharacterized protein DEU56DRAFT_926810 [Suillus clintonianus]KAG2148943.1 hypothetical protein DEU56DRAFT_926810 [Suillus clintonianus]
MYKPSSTQFSAEEEVSQRYNKGNVAVRPQNSTELRNLLPPSGDELRDAMCVIFSGQKQIPSRETVKKLRPVLVTKSRVQKLIGFLIDNNPWYQRSGVVYSQVNMDALFEEIDRDVDTGVPRALAICHLPSENRETTDEGFSSRDADETHNGDVEVGDIVMESVGYTEGDHSSISREKMKLHALAYVLDHKQFLLSRTGGKFVADNDPGLMSYLFPHLDPWDIGGFFHTGRTEQQYISMQQQVRNLVCQDDSPFRSDPHFAFKREVSLAKELKEIAPSLTTLADKWNNSVNHKPSTTEEKKAVRILRCLQASTKSVRGSVGYKLCRRNEIRSLIKKFCTPAQSESAGTSRPDGE